MSVIQEFRQVFHREIERSLADLQEDGASQGQEGLVQERVEELRQIGNQITENVLYRLVEHAHEWLPGSEAAGPPPTSAPKAESKQRPDPRIRELEEELQRKRAEVARRQEELFNKCKNEFAAALNAREEELLELQRDVCFDPSEVERRSASLGRAADVQQEFAEHMDLIRSRVACARKAAEELGKKKLDLGKIASQQSKGLSKGEEILASAWRSAGGLEPEDEAWAELNAALHHREQGCKRVRHHHRTAGAGA